jgi:hypothetical protein
MGIFGKILSSLGLADSTQAVDAPAATIPAAEPAAVGAPAAAPEAVGGPRVREAIPVVDVEAHMEQLAQAAGHEVNWRESIVDLLSLLKIDNSYAARKELAVELGCPPELMGDSAQMNMWLHKTVLQRIAANGGVVPKTLLD